ncbi:GLPGLI family protein [Salegentibacter mishustinae]|uniref:GLPGLI family protein n=1 Tax=Salegentibacter mishustinae TaxID=270918 RepID=UPI001CE105CC|nr:GLPGLI family protein [Salegentibacter mishustinae]UBZ07728.1 GLPGLI family protein [Salegentibacter mishustinae]
MKNKFIFILGVLMLSSFQLKAQNKLNYRVSYELTYKLDSTDLESSKSEIMWLFANNDSSLFISRGAALKDSIKKNVIAAEIGSEKWRSKMEAAKTEFEYQIFKNKAENKIGYGIKLLSDKLYYSNFLDQIKWEIQSDAKKIAGYQVQRATSSFAGRDYIAWFTPEIPLTDGPYKFAGLPGLILELQDTEAEYVFKFAGFEELANPLEYEIFPEKYKEVKKKELLDLVETYEKDPISYVNNYVGEGGKTVRIEIIGDDKKDYLRKHRAELAKKNNPIELEK